MENKSKHTPGPWKKQVIAGRFYYKIYTDTEHIAETDKTENAQLIAAAPELLAALERVLECHRLKISLDTNAGAVEQARAAIAKAKGE